ncbi:MAG: hypothetical protein CMB12_07060 [Euryarchaeota archaeon]|nr:hypothetical protein [Euryarchaeota archaeon]
MGRDDGRVHRIDTSGTKEQESPISRKSQDHHARFIDAIRWELDDEMEQVEDRLRNWSRSRLLAHGVSLFDLKARSAGWMYGMRLLRLSMEKGGPMPSHRFKHGDIVLLSRNEPLGRQALEGVVARRSRNHIVLAMNDLPKGHRQGIWRIDRGANRIAHDRMRDALNAFLGDEKATSLTGLLLGQGRDIEQSASVDHGIKGGKRAGLDTENELNSSQNEALNAATTRRLTLIQGPPGTGKTHTAVRILRRWSLEGNAPILAVAESNVAVDNLLQGLLAIGVDAVRLGQPVKVRESLRDATLDARMERHRLQKDLKAIIDLNESLARKISGLKGKEKGLAHKDLNRGWSDARRIEQQMKEDILNTATVICATCIGSGHDVLDGRRFPRVLIDEATQATEPATLVPIVRGCRQLVLVGDHRQLPPTVISRRAENGGLGISLFDRMRELGVDSIMLEEQYRMHPIISQFPSMQYYDDGLINGVKAEERPAPAGLIWPDFDRPVAFLPIEGGEVVSEDGHSRANPAEASWVVRILGMLLEPGDLDTTDIGVITPYNGQVRVILDLLEQAGGTTLGDRWHGVEVRSVDGYQGREKEVIILSTVRSNPEGEIGFLDDARRLNVAITRAKRGLIVIGDQNTLRNQRDWDFWLTWAQERSLMAWHLLHM